MAEPKVSFDMAAEVLLIAMIKTASIADTDPEKMEKTLAEMHERLSALDSRRLAQLVLFLTSKWCEDVPDEKILALCPPGLRERVRKML